MLHALFVLSKHPKNDRLSKHVKDIGVGRIPRILDSAVDILGILHFVIITFALMERKGKERKGKERIGLDRIG